MAGGKGKKMLFLKEADLWSVEKVLVGKGSYGGKGKKLHFCGGSWLVVCGLLLEAELWSGGNCGW